MSWIKKTGEGIQMLDALRIYISQKTYKPFTELRSFVEDARRFLNAFRSTIEEAPLQVYVSALPFAPKKSVVRQCFVKEIPEWIVRHPSVTDHWDTLLHMLHDGDRSFCCCDFSPSGNYVASGSDTGTIHLWDVSTWKCQQVLEGHEGSMLVLTFVSESLLASTSLDRTIRLWYLDTSRSKVLDLGHRFKFITGSPDGKKLSFGGQENELAYLYLYDLETEILSQKIDISPNSKVCFSPDSTLIAFNCDENKVELWDTAQNSFLRSFVCVIGPVKLAFSPNGNLLYGSSLHDTVTSWDVVTGDACTCISYDEYSDHYSCSAFSPNMRYIAMVRDYKLQLGDLLTGEKTTCALSIDLDSYHLAMYLTWTPTGKQVVVGDWDFVQIWDLAAQTTVKTIRNSSLILPHKFQISPDERFMIKCGRYSLCIWDLTLDTSDGADEFYGNGVKRLAFSPHCDRNLAVTDCNEGALRFWKSDTGDFVRTLYLPDDMGTLYNFAPTYGALTLFSANWKRILYGRVNRSITIWDVTTWELLRTLPCTPSYPVVATFSPDGTLVVTADVDGIEFWDVETGDKLTTINHETSLPRFQGSCPQQVHRWYHFRERAMDSPKDPMKRTPVCATISKRGGHLAIGYSDDSVAIFNFQTGELIRYLSQTTSPHTIASSAELLALAGDFIQIIELATGRELGLVSVHHTIQQLAFSEDGTRLNTEWGQFQIASIIHNPNPESKLLSEGIHYDKNWIWHGGQQIILVPHEHRPNGNHNLLSSFYSDGILAMGTATGRVSMIGLDGLDIGIL